MPWTIGMSLSPTYVDDAHVVVNCDVCGKLMYDSDEDFVAPAIADGVDDEGIVMSGHPKCIADAPYLV